MISLCDYLIYHGYAISYIQYLVIVVILSLKLMWLDLLSHFIMTHHWCPFIQAALLYRFLSFIYVSKTLHFLIFLKKLG